MERNYEVVKSKELSTRYDERYIVISRDTRETLDDAQGYGYKSVRKAYAAYAYKTRTPEQKAAKEKKDAVLKKWCKENKSFIRDLDQFAFEIAKGSWGPEDKVDTAFIKKMLKDYGYEDLPFTAKELLIFWQKR